MKCYLNSFKFDIFIAQCLGGYFFPNTVAMQILWKIFYKSRKIEFF